MTTTELFFMYLMLGLIIMLVIGLGFIIEDLLTRRKDEK